MHCKENLNSQPKVQLTKPESTTGMLTSSIRSEIMNPTVEATDLFHMQSQPLLRTEKLEKNFFLVCKIQSNIMICSPKPDFLYDNL